MSMPTCVRQFRISGPGLPTQYLSTRRGAAVFARRQPVPARVYERAGSKWVEIDWEAPWVDVPYRVIRRWYTTRFPWEPVANRLRREAGDRALPQTAMAAAVGVHHRQVHRWRTGGVPLVSADRIADALGVHPTELWADYYEQAATDDQWLVPT